MDFTLTLETLTSATAIGGYVAAALGMLVSQFWTRYLNRMVILRWSVTTSQVAASSETPAFGKIRVTFNDSPVVNLFFVKFELENESSRDLADVPFSLVVRDQSWLMGQGQSSYDGLAPWSGVFSEALQRAIAAEANQQPIAAADQEILMKRREFTLPVLNRGARLTLNLLASNPAGVKPRIDLICNYPGVRVLQQPEGLRFLGVAQRSAAAIGLIAGAVLVAAVAHAFDNEVVTSGISFLIGALVTLIGAGLIHLKRLVKKAVG